MRWRYTIPARAGLLLAILKGHLFLHVVLFAPFIAPAAYFFVLCVG